MRGDNFGTHYSTRFWWFGQGKFDFLKCSRIYFFMKRKYFISVLLGIFLFFGFTPFPFAQTPEEIYYEELKKEYVPQSSPEKSFQLELKLLSDGMYCYDLPLFDPQWRQKGKKILTAPQFQETAKKANKPQSSFIEGDYAVLYYPQDLQMAPVFLFLDPAQGWVLDHSAVADKVFYHSGNYESSLNDGKSFQGTDGSRFSRSPEGWMCVGGEYPYLNLLKKIFSFKKVTLDEYGVEGYEVIGFIGNH